MLSKASKWGLDQKVEPRPEPNFLTSSTRPDTRELHKNSSVVCWVNSELNSPTPMRPKAQRIWARSSTKRLKRPRNRKIKSKGNLTDFNSSQEMLAIEKWRTTKVASVASWDAVSCCVLTFSKIFIISKTLHLRDEIKLNWPWAMISSCII